MIISKEKIIYEIFSIISIAYEIRLQQAMEEDFSFVHFIIFGISEIVSLDDKMLQATKSDRCSVQFSLPAMSV